jgi:hypothetical protein
VFCDQALLSSEDAVYLTARLTLAEEEFTLLQEIFSATRYTGPIASHRADARPFAPERCVSTPAGSNARIWWSLDQSGSRAGIVSGLCTARAACAPRARLKEPSPDGPAISGLALVPGRP